MFHKLLRLEGSRITQVVLGHRRYGNKQGAKSEGLSRGGRGTRGFAAAVRQLQHRAGKGSEKLSPCIAGQPSNDCCAL